MRAILAAIAVAASLLAPAARAGPRPPVAVLVELFSSEGCSSCPPAESVLARLVREQPVPGARIVAVGQHVDYWDGPGWRDRFSSPAFSRRQGRYARALGSSVYTPQAVIDGRREVVGGDERSLRAAIAESVRRPKGKVTLGAGGASGEKDTFRVDASWDAGVEADVYVATVEHGARSEVTGGENAGRLLRHAPLTRSLVRLGTAAGSFHGTFTVARTAGEESAREVVVFVQERGQGAVVALGTARLPGA